MYFIGTYPTLVFRTTRRLPSNLMTNLEERPSGVSLSFTRNVPRPLSVQFDKVLSKANNLQLICKKDSSLVSALLSYKLIRK